MHGLFNPDGSAARLFSPLLSYINATEMSVRVPLLANPLTIASTVRRGNRRFTHMSSEYVVVFQALRISATRWATTIRICVIGVRCCCTCGVSGCGTTRLLKQLGRIARESPLGAPPQPPWNLQPASGSLSLPARGRFRDLQPRGSDIRLAQVEEC